MEFGFTFVSDKNVCKKTIKTNESVVDSAVCHAPLKALQ